MYTWLGENICYKGDGNVAQYLVAHMHPLPGVPVVETERDFVHTARVAHHEVEAGLSETKYEYVS